MVYIPIILGTGRIGRKSMRAAKFLKRELEKRKITTEIIDVREYSPCFTPEKPGPYTDKLREYAEKVSKSDAIIIVAPEYNHSFPGELKVLLDSIYDEYYRKPVGICSVSSGVQGGRCVIDALRPIVVTLGMIPIKSSINFSNIEEDFDEDGNTRNERFYKRAERFINELLWLAKAISSARKN